MFFLIYSLMIFISTMMMSMSHPLSMGLMILLQTMLICLITGMLIKSYWFSYILFLTFLGGMLIMFIYVSSIASNEMFKFKFKNIMMSLYLNFIMIIIMFFMMKNNNLISIINNMEMNFLLEKFLFFNNENKINLMKIYNNMNYQLTMMLITYLLITLIAVIKIINNNFYALRTL